MAEKEGKSVLITGGAGGVGAYIARRFAGEGHRVRVFDLPTAANKKAFSAPEPNIELFWGDITDRARIAEGMKGIDCVIHLAAILPPTTEKNPELARKVNVDGSRTVCEAASEEASRSGKPVGIRYSSSVTVYGITAHLKPPLPPDQPVNPCDTYSETKAKAEEVVRASGLPYTVMRFAAAVYLDIRKGGFEQMRIISPENRIEFVHIYDVAESFINSVDNPEAENKTLVIAGGPRCQLIYRDQIKRTFDFLGFPEPNWSKFTKEPFNLDWYDTTEAQRILRYQTRSFDDYLLDFKKALGWKYPAIRYAAGPAMRLLRIHL